MKKIVLIFFISLSFIMAQSWKPTVDLSISAGSSDRISLFSNQAGNHLLVQKSNQLNYYLYKYDGTLIRATTLDTYSESKRLNVATGANNVVYAIYKKGNNIITKRTENDGVTWTELNTISLTYTVSDGMDATANNDKAFLTWSEKQGSSSVYETYYMDIDHSQNNWKDKK